MLRIRLGADLQDHISSARDHFGRKLASRYILSRVTRKLSRLVYQLSNLDGTKVGNSHIRDLKPYRGPTSDSEQNIMSDDSE